VNRKNVVVVYQLFCGVFYDSNFLCCHELSTSMHSYKMLMQLPSLIFTGLMNRLPCYNRLKTKEMSVAAPGSGFIII
jgi:hypothetical protein